MDTDQLWELVQLGEAFDHLTEDEQEHIVELLVGERHSGLMMCASDGDDSG